MRQLTDEQRLLVTENMGLVYSQVYKLMRSGKLLPHLHDDAISEGMLGLMKAAYHYDPSRGYRFSTLASMSIHRQVVGFIKKEINQTKAIAISLDKPNTSRAGETLGEIIPANDDIESEAVEWLNEAVLEVLANHTTVEKADIFMDYMSGRNMVEIARDRGVTRQRIFAVISDIKKILRKELKRNEWRN